MNAITNFSLAEKINNNSITTLLFSFIKPTDVSGYILYRSSDNVTYTSVSILSDAAMYKNASSTYDMATYTFFPYTFEEGTAGNTYYFYICTVDIYNNVSAASPILTVNTFPMPVQSIETIYNNYSISCEYVPQSDPTVNTNVTAYNVQLVQLQEFTGFTIAKDILYSASLADKDYVLIRDNDLTSYYGGIVTSTGSFTYLNKIYNHISDSTAEVVDQNSAQCFKPVATVKDYVTTSTGVTFPNAIIDANNQATIIYTPGTLYAVRVCTINAAGDYSLPSYFPVLPILLKTSYPIIRRPSNSESYYLSASIWEKLKAALIDSKYYKKELWDIPYNQSGTTNLVGTCAVAYCNIDLFINDNYNTTTTSDKYGNFSFDYKFNKGKTKVTIQARDYKNTQFSQMSVPIYVNTVNMYSWFYALSTQYVKLSAAYQYILNGVNVKTSSYAQFVDNYQALIELEKDADEDETTFQAFAHAIFNCFEYVSFDQSLVALLDAFKSYIPGIKSYNVYYNNGLFPAKRFPEMYISQSNGLPRNIYTYVVSAVRESIDGIEETKGIEIEVDTRYYPVGYDSKIVLTWEPVYGASYYKIYRKATYELVNNSLVKANNKFGCLSTSTGIIKATIPSFADNNVAWADTTIQPKQYNFSKLNEIDTIETVKNLQLTAFNDVALKTLHYINIIIYMTDDTTLSSVNMNRLFFYIDKLLPPEKNYTLLLCNNSKSTIYNYQGVAL